LRFQPGDLPPSRNPYLVYIGKHASDESRRTLKGCLDRVAEIISPTREARESPSGSSVTVSGSGTTVRWWLLGYEDGELLKTALVRRGYSASSINKHLSAYRQVLTTSWRLGHLSAEALKAAVDIEHVKGERLPAGRSVGTTEVAAMLTACLTDGVIGIRDAAIIAVLASTGARRDEVANMRIEHFDAEERIIKIVGKGNKEREVFVHADALLYLDNWLRILDDSTGPMFRAITRWGQIRETPLKGLDIGRVTARWRKRAGIRPMTTHDMRRTFASVLLDESVDLATVQQLMGHSSPVTTARYDRRPSRGRRAAVDKLHLPRPGDLVTGNPAAIETPTTEGTDES
jgi:integrase